MTFKEKYLAGEISFEEIDDFIEEWNESDDGGSFVRVVAGRSFFE